jgi:hypothetical protein
MNWKSVNWTKWSSIGEIVSSIAIVVTLGYLAIQVRQNTVAINAESRTALWQLQGTALQQVVQNPRIHLNMKKVEPLTEEEKIELSMWLFVFVGNREFMWLQSHSGIVDELTMETLMSDVVGILVFPRVMAWWRLVSDFYFDPAFVQLVNSRATDEALADFQDPMELWQ